jgi:RNase P/RNase MRP subunit p30
MRSPREFVSLVNTLGLDIGRAFASVTSNPQMIVEGNKKTIEGSKIDDNVEVVD